jgi:hypothetical protein
MNDSTDIMDIIDNQIPAATAEYQELTRQSAADPQNEELRQNLLAAIDRRNALLNMVNTTI